MHTYTKKEMMAGNGGAKSKLQGGGGSATPCAGCKLLRRRCVEDCIFAPYFPAAEIHKFACVHKVFGASNVSKMLQELPEQRRSDAVSSMVYDANARIRDPINGCVGAISCLQQQVEILQKQLAEAQAELVYLRLYAQPPKRKTPSSLFAMDDEDIAIFEHHNNETDANTSLAPFWSD